MRPVAIGGMAIMKLTAILMLLAMAVHATAQSNLMLGVAPLEPCWSVVVSPREWPREPGGSNTVIQCVAFVEGEVEASLRITKDILQGWYRGSLLGGYGVTRFHLGFWGGRVPVYRQVIPGPVNNLFFPV